MAFELSIPSAHLRHFAATIQSLAHAGRELIFEVVPPGASQASRTVEGVLTIRALNDAHSVFSAVTFDRPFFERIRFDQQGDTSAPSFKGSVVAKALAPMLRKATAQRHAGVTGAAAGGGGDRSFGAGERRRAAGSGVLRLLISCTTRGDHDSAADDDDYASTTPMLVFELQHDLGVRRRWEITYEEAEVLHATFDAQELGAAHVTTTPISWARLLEHIQGAPELACTVSRTTLRVASFHASGSSDSSGPTGGGARLQTEIVVSAQEFDLFTFGADDTDIDDEVTLIFNLRELKALVACCQKLDAPALSFYFTQSESQERARAHIRVSRAPTQITPTRSGSGGDVLRTRAKRDRGRACDGHDGIATRTSCGTQRHHVARIAILGWHERRFMLCTRAAAT